MSHSIYLSNVMDRTIRRRKVAAAATLMRKKQFRKAAIVASGISGVIIAVCVSEELKRNFAAVRKSKESNHGQLVEATDMIYGPYVIIDDQIDTGATVNHIILSMETHHPKSKCIGIILHDGQWTQTEHKGVPIFHV